MGERRKPRACLHAAILACGLVASPAGADDASLRSIALLWSQSGCTPAVSVAPGTFFVGARALDAVCPGGACERVDLYVPVGDGSGEMVRLRSPRVSLARRVDSLDVASLDVRSPDLSHVTPLPIAEPSPGRVVRILDFPGCETLVGRYGVVAREGALGFVTTIPSHTVEPGAIVLDEERGVVGIVRSGLSAGVAGPRWLERVILLPARATRASAARAVLGGGERESLAAEVALWNRAYDEDLAATGAAGRLRAAPAFHVGVGRVATRALTIEGGGSVADAVAGSYRLGLLFLQPAAHAGTRPAATPPVRRRHDAAAERLAAAHALATRGLLGPRLAPIDVDALVAGLRSSGRPTAQVAGLEAMVERERASSPFGPVGPLAALLGLALGTALVVAVAWGWSLGVVFKTSRGGVVSRAAKTVLVGLVLWPLSLLFFWLFGAMFRRRRESRDMTLAPDGWTL